MQKAKKATLHKEKRAVYRWADQAEPVAGTICGRAPRQVVAMQKMEEDDWDGNGGLSL